VLYALHLLLQQQHSSIQCLLVLLQQLAVGQQVELIPCQGLRHSQPLRCELVLWVLLLQGLHPP
jgi:hypothetical protein